MLVQRISTLPSRRISTAPVRPWVLSPSSLASPRSFASTPLRPAAPPPAPASPGKKKGKRAKDPLDNFYSESLNLPKTVFPLRAEAARRDKLFWARTTDELYQWQVRPSRSTETCTLSSC